MEKIVKYEMSETDYKELEYKFGLLQKALRDEKFRLSQVDNKTQNEVISYNTIEYACSLIYDLHTLLC